MNRRELLVGGIALAGAAMVGQATAQTDTHEHAHHHGGGVSGTLTLAIADCIQKGEACLNHCIELLGQGEREMAACAKTVNEMLAVCGALRQLANQNSQQSARMAAIAMDVCRQCEDECKKHAAKHETCKACGESCKACYDECRKLVG